MGHPIVARNPARGVPPLRLQQHVAANRRRHRRAATTADAAVLDNGRAHIPRRSDRREGDEQCVITVLPRDLTDPARTVLAGILADVAHL